ncbi:MAG: M50 family metallopeptidase, partial [Sphingopyxis sp.]
SAAARAGIMPGDRIISIDGRMMDKFVDIPMAVMHRAGEPMDVVLDRAGARHVVRVTPTAVTETDEFGNEMTSGKLGVRNPHKVITAIPLWQAPIVASQQAWGITRQMGEVIGQLFLGKRSIKDLGGPLKIARASGQQASLGAAEFVFFVALISINLGFVNLLPLPMLDGGHLLFNAVEAVRRRPASIAAQQWAFRAGFAVLATLMIIVTFNDLSSFGLWQRLAGLIG